MNPPEEAPGQVLIIDDEEELRRMWVLVLGKRGFRVTGAASGEEGLALAKTQAFDAVLLDIMMPGLDGLETLRELRRLAPRTEIVMVTGHPTPEAAAEDRARGAFDFLAKPVLLPHLRRVLEQAVLKSRSRTVEP